ncbi:ATP synthase B chain, partial [Trichinella spiralis]|uniref:ATP synthase B chain n=1 Tax=Trichinella spiralis TaxID=6334 RepID=UPI0001EFB9FC
MKCAVHLRSILDLHSTEHVIIHHVYTSSGDTQSADKSCADLSRAGRYRADVCRGPAGTVN